MNVREQQSADPSFDETIRAWDARARELERWPLPAVRPDPLMAQDTSICPRPTHLTPLADLGCYWRIVYHEAGHATTAIVLGGVVERVEIGGYDRLGVMKPKPETYLNLPISDRLVIKLAGAEAERRHWPPLRQTAEYQTFDCYDMEEARQMIADARGVLLGDPAVTEDIRRHQARAARLVERHWPWVERVARALGTWRRLTGAEVLALRNGRAWT